MKLLTVGQIAKEAGVTAVTIRFYEKHGLLPKASRSPAGYRLYSSQVIEQLIFIKNSQLAGFSLQEITQLLKIIGQKNISSKPVKIFLQQKIDSLYEKITSLKLVMTTLRQLQDTCDGKMNIDDCPIIRALANKTTSKLLAIRRKKILSKI